MSAPPAAPNTAPQPLGASFRDPSGFLYRANGVLYRQVNQAYQAEYDLLMTSGLYQELVDAHLLIPHQEVEIPAADPARAYKVLQPEPLEFVSYPYEWCFSQLKDAALTTLRIQKRALKHGMSLKDASAYNIQFRRGRPVLIDTLSFEAYLEGSPWVAYRQFCQHFLAALSLAAYRDVRLAQLLRVHIDGLPLALAARLLPWRTRLNFALAVHIHAHAASQQRFAGRAAAPTQKVSRAALLGLLDSLESAVRKLKWSPASTAWSDYYDETNYTPAGLEHKQRLVAEFLEQVQPTSVWDLGANTGRFSRLASGRGIPTLAFDNDPLAVEKAYLEVKANKEANLLPLLLDLTNPSPAIGWENQERLALLQRGPADAILALALVHHLAIGNNLPLGRIAAFFARLGRWLVVEFAPKPDSQVQRLLASRLDIFPDYSVEGFERAFSAHFTLRRAELIQDSQRRLYLFENIHPPSGSNFPN
jgi:hypothetical protein